MGIEYDPSKTPQEMAEAAGVSLTDVRNFLQRNPICNYRADRANYFRKRVMEFFSRMDGTEHYHPEKTVGRAS